MFWLFASALFYSIVHGGESSVANCAGNGWTIWKGNCYKLFTMAESMNFAEAENVCRQSGAHTTSVHSEAENKFLASMSQEAFHLLETNVPSVNGQPLYWDRIHGGLWIGYRRHPAGANSEGQFECVWADGTPMDYANAPEPDSVRQQTKTQAHWKGYPWEGPNPDKADVSIAVCGKGQCSGDMDQCVEMLNWPGSIIGTWNDLSCTHHKLSGVFCKKPVNCEL